MHKLVELKDMLCEELEEYASKDLTASSLDMVDKLAHAVKNIDKIINESEYSGDMPYHERSYRRDARGRYSRGKDVASEIRELMDDTSDERVRKELRKVVQMIEQR